MKVVSFIPVKLNNQRIPGKNIKLLGGKPACSYIFDTVLGVSNIDERYVYCSDDAFRPYVPEGIKFLKRSPTRDLPTTKGLEIIGSFLRDVDADIYVITHVTAPFLKSETMEKAIEAVKSGEYDSAFTAQEIKSYCWYDGKPVNYNLTDIVTTQNLVPIYNENSGFYIFTKEVFTKMNRRIGNKPYIACTDNFESVDLDTPDDFEFAQAVALFKSNQNK